MNRTELIQKLIDKYDLRSYLEIGVFQGANFDKIQCEAKESVDPKYPATHQMTSNEFFRDNPYLFDIIFIDGLHTAEQTYIDIDNASRMLFHNGFIVVHDCNPATKWHTRPPEEYKQGQEWNGETYKGFIRYKQEHPELTCFTVDCDYGCGVITDRFDTSVKDVTWEEFSANRKSLLNLVDVNELDNLLK